MGNCVSCRGCACRRLPKVEGEDDYGVAPIKATAATVPRSLPLADIETTKDTDVKAPPPIAESIFQTAEDETQTEAEDPTSQPLDTKSDIDSEHDSETLFIKETSPYESKVIHGTITESMTEAVPVEDVSDGDPLFTALDDVAALEDFVTSVSIETPLKQKSVVTPFAVTEEGETEDEVEIPMNGIEEGKGESNGIDYSFKLTRKSYFAEYEEARKRRRRGCACRCLCLKRTESGHLAVYLYSGDDQPTTDVHYWITIVNRSRSKDICGGASARFEPGSNSGQPQLAALTRLTQLHQGFIIGSAFTVRLDMRIKLPENEEQLVSIEKQKATIMWRIRDIWDMSPSVIRSDTFEINNTKWQLRLHPYGTSRERDTASVFLDNRSALTASAKFTLKTPNHRVIHKSMSKGLDKAFRPGEGWGYHEYIDTEALRDERVGYQENGWFMIQGEVTLEPLGHRVNRRTLSTPGRMPTTRETSCILCSNASLTSAFMHGDKHVQS